VRKEGEKFIPIGLNLSEFIFVTKLNTLLAFASLALASCESRSDIEVANEKNILVIGNSNEPKGLDPHLVSGVLESNIIRALFEGLVVDHPSKDSTSVDGVAIRDQIQHSDDFTEWTFPLNPEAKWSDGHPVTAHDFVFSYQRLLSPDPNWPAKYAEMLYFLKNGEAYHRNKYGQLLCSTDPDFPLEWDLLKNANFDGDDKIVPSKYLGKDYSSLSERERQRFLKYLNDSETPDFEALNQKNFDYQEASMVDQKIFFNSIGLDHLDKEQLVFLRENLKLLDWSEHVSPEIQQLVVDRLISHHELGKPNLWNQAKVGVEAINEHTLKITLRGPTPFLLEITKHYTWYPVPKHIVLKHGEINTAYSSPWTRLENIVSNGAFKLKTWRTNHLLEVERNPHYWDAKNVKLDGIRYMPINNYYTETRMFGDDQLHLTYTVPSELIPMAKKKYSDQLRQESYVGTRFLRVNTLNEPFNNPKVRRAFALAIDQEAICEKILQGGQKPASGIVPPFGDYVVPSLIHFDPEQAKALLKESGYESTSSFPDIDLLTTNSDSGLREAEALQAMWQKHLGIKVRIQQREWTTYLQKQYDSDYDIVVAGWIGDYLDPTTFLEMWVSGGGNNNTGWSSKVFEDLLRKAEHTADIPTRMGILSEAEKTMMKDTPVLPIYWYTTNYLIRPEVKNWHPLLLNNHPFKFVELQKN